MSAHLPEPLFRSMVENTPLISLDLVVRNAAGEVLLGQRLNRPARGFWFVPGGRVRKNERLTEAFARLTREELGVERAMSSARFLGPYEHHYPDNFSGTDFSTHYVVLAYELTLDVALSALPVQQHDAYRWWSQTELLVSSEVHVHTQWYFQS